tara:strand:+ start:6985 stop:7296 length:312 start_codon:yes stop_codon:yes gene_type:complete
MHILGFNGASAITVTPDAVPEAYHAKAGGNLFAGGHKIVYEPASQAPLDIRVPSAHRNVHLGLNKLNEIFVCDHFVYLTMLPLDGDRCQKLTKTGAFAIRHGA